MCGNGIDFATFYYFSIGFRYCFNSVVFFSSYYKKTY